MAVNFKNNPKPSPAPAAKAAAPAAKPALSFLKRGKEAKAIAEQEDKKAEMRGKDYVSRFFVPLSVGTGCITFLDGDLVDGILDIPFFHEHNVNMNGKFNNFFICTQDEEPCPICEGGAPASYVGAMSVIDHAEWKDKNGVTHRDVRKLFVAKRDTIKLLQQYAVKRGGLRGCTFDVSRVGDKSPAVGSAFDFTEKLTEAQLVAKYKSKGPKDPDRSMPLNYEEYLQSQYQPASELRKLGFGSSSNPVGSESGTGYDV